MRVKTSLNEQQQYNSVKEALEAGYELPTVPEDYVWPVVMLSEDEIREGWKFIRRDGVWMKVLNLNNVNIQLVRDDVSEQEQVVLANAYDYAKLVRELKICEPIVAHEVTRRLLDKKYDLLLSAEKLIFITNRPPALTKRRQ